MKIRVTMKDPDCLHNAVREQVKTEIDKLTGLFETERDHLVEDRIEHINRGCSKWFRYGEYLTVEIDTEAGTCVVVPAGQ